MKPKLDQLEGTVSERVLDALDVSNEIYQELKPRVRYALAGGLAVAAYGFVRNTRDVDYVVGEEAFVGDRVKLLHPGIPWEADGVQVDPVSLQPKDRHIIDVPPKIVAFRGKRVPVVDIRVLFYMKLRARRTKDKADLVELIKAGSYEVSVLDYITAYGDESMLELLHDLVGEANKESR